MGETEEEKCSICLENLTGSSELTLICGHKFHIKCYTEFIVHRIKELSNGVQPKQVRCPYCRTRDKSMLPIMLDSIIANMEAHLVLQMFSEDVNDLVIKEFIPHMQSILNSASTFNKRNLINVLRKTLKDNERSFKAMMKDLKD